MISKLSYIHQLQRSNMFGMISVTNNKYIWSNIFNDKLYLCIRLVEHYGNGKVYHTIEGVNLDTSEAYAFFNIFKSAWKSGEIFNLSPYKIAHYVSGYGEVLNIVSVTEEDDGRRTAGKGIMLKDF